MACVCRGYLWDCLIFWGESYEVAELKKQVERLLRDRDNEKVNEEGMRRKITYINVY